MYLPRNNGKCLLTAQLSPRKRRERLRRACSFDFIPFVYDTTAVGHQQLKCHSITRKFAKCPKADVIDKDKCKNKLCPPKPTTKKPDKGRKCGWSCDYALLVSGGWSKYINRIRHLHNIQEVFKHLQTSRSFDKENIKVFFANNATIELDGDLKAKETVPAVDALTITRHVRSVCSRNTKCIDTFVIYLNGPTTKNGDLLLWDWNADGKAKQL
uniref:Putative cnidarian restricted protein n=1 Tax=Clytia hemisphaerica TaxID=252671 RepID=A0A069DNE7_9CNID